MSKYFIHLVSKTNFEAGSRESALEGGKFHSFGIVNEEELEQIKQECKYESGVYISNYHQNTLIHLQSITSDPTEIKVLQGFFAKYDQSRDANMIRLILDKYKEEEEEEEEEQ